MHLRCDACFSVVCKLRRQYWARAASVPGVAVLVVSVASIARRRGALFAPVGSALANSPGTNMFLCGECTSDHGEYWWVKIYYIPGFTGFRSLSSLKEIVSTCPYLYCLTISVRNKCEITLDSFLISLWCKTNFYYLINFFTCYNI